jgi:hypothetical protein
LGFPGFFEIFFPIEVEKKGGWRRRMKGKRVFEGRRKNEDQRREDTTKKTQDGPTRQKKIDFLVGFFSYIFLVHGWR